MEKSENNKKKYKDADGLSGFMSINECNERYFNGEHFYHPLVGEVELCMPVLNNTVRCETKNHKYFDCDYTELRPILAKDFFIYYELELSKKEEQKLIADALDLCRRLKVDSVFKTLENMGIYRKSTTKKKKR